jgi:hypothetical protein
MDDFERVYEVTQYHDQPLAGAADFHGRPHFFEREFDSVADEYSAIYQLSPISADLAALAMEHRDISRRWWSAYYDRRVPDAEHRALQEELPRYLELERIFSQSLKLDPSAVVKAKAAFRTEPSHEGTLLPPLQVKWDRP